METPMKRWLLAIATAASMLSLTGCGYNDFQRLDEKSKAAWSEVLNQYQRRSDLIPNIVATVKGEANFEQETLTRVIEARAKATSIQATPELINNPEAFNKFQQAQGEISSALSRLMVVAERYPGSQGQPGLPRSACDAGGHGKSHHRGTQRIHRHGAGLQRACAQLPHQYHGQGIQLPGQTDLHGAERGPDFQPPAVDFSTPAAPAGSK